MSTLFVSDIHISAERPDQAQAFIDFLHGPARRADAVYILGDLFDLWLGDDDDTPPYPTVVTALTTLKDHGTALSVMRGNRDFLLGSDFANRTSCQLLDDAVVIDLFGEPTLLMHGDTLCTDDRDYQALRRKVRNPGWQRQVLTMPLDERRQYGQQLREESLSQSSRKKPDIMDVAQSAVEQAFLEHNVSRLIHGHTHRPDRHTLSIEGRAAERIVLGDWYEQDSILICDQEGCRFTRLNDL